MIAAIAGKNRFDRADRRRPGPRKALFWAFFIAAIAGSCEIEREDCTQETKAFLAQTCLHLDHISQTCEDSQVDCEYQLEQTEKHCDLSVCLDTDETADCLEQLENFDCQTFRDLRCFETPPGMCDYSD